MSFNRIKIFLEKNNYNFLHIQTTESTMLEVKKNLKKNLQNFAIISDIQTNGKGRRGNIWHSPKGNIYCSISFKNFLEKDKFSLFNILIAISIKMTFLKYDNNEIKFKWPNDLFFKNKKFGGIIAENYKLSNQNFIIVGFGINILTYPKLDKYETTCANEFSEVKDIPNFMEIFFQILFKNLELLHKGELEKIINIYKKSLMFIGDIIEIQTISQSTIKGKFTDINQDGSIKLKYKKNFITIYNGTIKI